MRHVQWLDSCLPPRGWVASVRSYGIRFCQRERDSSFSSSLEGRGESIGGDCEISCRRFMSIVKEKIKMTFVTRWGGWK